MLVRSNGKAAQVAGWLMEEGIPVVTDNSFLLAEHPLMEEITALLTFLDSPRNDLAFWTFLSGRQMLLPLIPLSEQALEDWAAARRTSERRNMPLFMAFREDFPDIWRKWIAPFHADARLLTPYDVTREALGRLDIWSRYPDEAAFVRRFLEIIHVAEGQGYGSLSRSSTIGTSTASRKSPHAGNPRRRAGHDHAQIEGAAIPRRHRAGITFPNGWTALPSTHVDGLMLVQHSPGLRLCTTRLSRTTPVKRCTCFMWRGRGRKRSCTPS